MARLPRLCLAGMPQHVIQRGVNRTACFASDEDMAAYAFWLEECSRKQGVAIHAWVFMTNHVHLLVTPDSSGAVSRMMQTLGRHYVRYFNHSYRRSGTLWEGRFKSCVVNAEEYFLTCQRYIELNPVRAGMVQRPEDYAWSSYRSNGLNQPAKLWSPHEVYLKLGLTVDSRTAAYRSLFKNHVDDQTIKDIRSAVNKGLALGNDRFKQDIEILSGRRVVELKRGPKATAKKGKEK